MSAIQKFTLPNGVRIILEPNDVMHSAAIGLWCRTGSRHELDTEAGITHFIEHMLFKGTASRTAKEIAEAIEGRGGMLNAFTDKEHTCYYCRVLSDDLANGVEVLSDMVLNSTLDAEEIKRESGVIVEEIKRSEDEPGDHVHELHIENRWMEHPLGKPIIGTRESVTSFEQRHFKEYMSRRYRGDNLVLSIAGRMDIPALVDLATRLFEDVPSGGEAEALPQTEAKVETREIKQDVEQVHFCIGTDSVHLYSTDIYTVAVMDSILGGGMSSRLFQEIREKRGLAYSIGSYNLSYSAAGLFTVYGGTGRANWEQVQELTRAEFKKIREVPVPADELERSKKQMSGNIVLALEGMSARMMRMSRNELHHRRDISVEETLDRVHAVSASDIQELAQQMFAEDQVSLTAIVPN
jgi:predicted Zn-dependent peptidase